MALQASTRQLKDAVNEGVFLRQECVFALARQLLVGRVRACDQTKESTAKERQTAKLQTRLLLLFLVFFFPSPDGRCSLVPS